MNNSTIYSCNGVTTFASCGSMGDVRLIALVFIVIGLISSCAMSFGPKRILLKGANWSNLNGAQQLTIILPLSCICATIGCCGSFVVKTYQESEDEAPFVIQLLMPIFLYSFACNLLQYLILVYVLFWLQVLEVKREQYLKKVAAKEASSHVSSKEQGSNSPMSPKRGDNEKSRKEIEAKKRDMGRKVMDLARKRHKLMAFAFRFNCACILISTILGVVAVGMDRQTLEGRKNQQVCVALIMAVGCTHICLPLYALATLGKTQVQLYNKRNVTHLYWSTVIVFTLVLIAAIISIVDQFALAVDENGGAGKTSVPNNIFLVFAGFFCVLGTFQLNKLLSIPVKAARRQGKVKGAPGGGNRNITMSSDNDDPAASPDNKRRGSTLLIRGGLMDTQAFNNSKVVPESGRGEDEV